MSFWEKYEELCREKGLKPSSNEMEVVTGVKSPSITGWKKGAKPKFDVIDRLAEFFDVDVRYLLDLSDSRHGEDTIEAMTDKLTNFGVDVVSFDDERGPKQNWALLYDNINLNLTAPEYKDLCVKLQTALNDAELFTMDRFCRETFKKEVFPDASNTLLTKDEMDIIARFRDLSANGKIKVLATLIDEERLNH